MASTSRESLKSAPPKEADTLVKEAFARRSKPPPKERRVADDGGPGARFVTTNGVVGLRLKVAPLPLGRETPGDDERTRAVLQRQLRSLKFRRHVEKGSDGHATLREGVFESADPAVVEWLRHRIAGGHVRHVREDYSRVKLRCAHCDAYTYDNTQPGQNAYMRHLLEAHPGAV